jgi:hypothetical protein
MHRSADPRMRTLPRRAQTRAAGRWISMRTGSVDIQGVIWGAPATNGHVLDGVYGLQAAFERTAAPAPRPMIERGR